MTTKENQAGNLGADAAEDVSILQQKPKKANKDTLIIVAEIVFSLLSGSIIVVILAAILVVSK